MSKIALLCCLLLTACTSTPPPQTEGKTQATIPTHVMFDGQSFIRLNTKQLQALIVGRNIAPVIEYSPHETSRSFGRDGRYSVHSGRDANWGRYLIANDVVWTYLSGKPRQLFFFQATDGGLLSASTTSPVN